ncbi:MAG TPA: hypothetical protein VK461_16150, partial [Acidimicrobiales bacterium]|nr:hypothetical protein [Acidimicrobiales bacterium]
LLDAVDALYRAGWVAHAWTNLGGVAPVLFRLHRDSDAAVVVGACEASDLTTFKTAELPDEARHALEHDPELVESRMLGARLSVPEVLRLLATP